MQPERLSPHDWLARQPLKPDERLFVILANASDAEPLQAWRSFSPEHPAAPIWADTVYAEWEAVMPYVAIVAAGSEFLQWVATTEACDWGWLVVSAAPPDLLVEHLRGLTQVRLPDGSAVFFRFWDGRFLQPILQCPQVDAAQLLPFARRCLINGQSFEIHAPVLGAPRDFPWWQVPEALLDQLAGHSTATRVNNLLNWLSEHHPDLFEAFSDSVLQRKVSVFLEAPEPSPMALVQYLKTELTPL